MESFEISNDELCVAIPETLNRSLVDYLIRDDGDEDLCFALYNASIGNLRTTVLIQEIIFPEEGDRQRHGNVSFNPKYFRRVSSIAMKKQCGIVMLHSHPGGGWQDMSTDDNKAESKLAPTALTLTNVPLVGLTIGSDGTWSARMWEYKDTKYIKKWSTLVRVVGELLTPHFAPHLSQRPIYREEFKRTLSVWGKEGHDKIARLRIGIVGLGSVGSIIAETLARMGLQKFVLIDFDEVQKHNLDRLLGATQEDIGFLKVDIAYRQIRKSATANNIEIIKVPFSIAEKEGYTAGLDCDFIFSCVDRPRPRYILNHMAYNHLIQVVDGGIRVRMPKGIFDGVDWQLQTVGPGKPCLKCIGSYEPSDVTLEKDGKLEDPSYFDTLPEDHYLKRNENIFPFSANLASLEVFQFIALATNIGDVSSFGVQRFRYKQGIISKYSEKKCAAGCDFPKSISDGDKFLQIYGMDIAARNARKRQKDKNKLV